MQATLPELTDRAREIFRQLVEGYLATGTPVGSRTLSRLGALGLSAASIRNVMQDLEELGLLAAPHPSAGRVPTDIGLRLFVDGMMQSHDLTAAEQAAIEEGARPRSDAVEDVLARTTAALSAMAHCAGVVFAPKTEIAIRQISFVALSPGRALAVLVGEGGSVENRIVELPPGIPASAFVEAANYANARLTGLTLAQAVQRLHHEIAAERAELDTLSATVIERGLAVWSEDGAARPILIVRGQAHLVGDGAADLERVRLLLGDLEGKEEIARLLDLARTADAMKVFIGAENKLFSLSGSSVIAAPWRAGGRVVGVVGVIGPTRLNYARVVPMVDFTANALSRLLQ